MLNYIEITLDMDCRICNIVTLHQLYFRVCFFIDLFAKFFNDSGNIARWTRGNPYLYLLGQYMQCYLPVNGSCSPAAHDVPDHSSEFLQFAIDYWMDSVLVVKHEYGNALSYKEEYLRQGSMVPSRSSRLSAGSPLSPFSTSLVGYKNSSGGRSGHHGTPRSASHVSPRHTQTQNHYPGVESEQ